MLDTGSAPSDLGDIQYQSNACPQKLELFQHRDAIAPVNNPIKDKSFMMFTVSESVIMATAVTGVQNKTVASCDNIKSKAKFTL